jgi:hypothetical protein
MKLILRFPGTHSVATGRIEPTKDYIDRELVIDGVTIFRNGLIPSLDKVGYSIQLKYPYPTAAQVDNLEDIDAKTNAAFDKTYDDVSAQTGWERVVGWEGTTFLHIPTHGDDGGWVGGGFVWASYDLVDEVLDRAPLPLSV